MYKNTIEIEYLIFNNITCNNGGIYFLSQENTLIAKKSELYNIVANSEGSILYGFYNNTIVIQ